MKRAAAITLLCMGAGAAAVSAAFEEPCNPQGQSANRNAVAQTVSPNSASRSCGSGGHGGHGGFFSRVVRGGFGRSGRGFGS